MIQGGSSVNHTQMFKSVLDNFSSGLHSIFQANRLDTHFTLLVERELTSFNKFFTLCPYWQEIVLPTTTEHIMY